MIKLKKLYKFRTYVNIGIFNDIKVKNISGGVFMIITADIGQPIVDQMIKVIDYNVNIMNNKGIIVASGDRSRIHQIHQGAIEAIELKRERIIHTTDYENMMGTVMGINVPIEINNNIVGVVGITGDPTKIYKYIHIIKVTVESLLKQQLLIEQLRYKQTELQEWIQNLADESFNDFSLLNSKAEYLNIDMNIKCSIVVIEIKDFNKSISDFENLRQNEEKITRAIKLYIYKSIFQTYLEKGIFVVGYPILNKDDQIKCNDTCKMLHEELEKDGFLNYIGIGEAKKGIYGYRLSIFEALQSIDILKQVNSNQKIAHIAEWGIVQLIAQIPGNVRKNYISQFTDSNLTLNSELEETLNTFLENNLNIKQTSEKIHIHRNTLIYRLDKIKELWGLDPRKFSDAVKLQLLYWCKRLNRI